MTKEETVKICDQCEKEVRYPTSEVQYGGSPLSEWVEIRINGSGSTMLDNMVQNENYDFCSKSCAIEKLQSLERWDELTKASR